MIIAISVNRSQPRVGGEFLVVLLKSSKESEASGPKNTLTRHSHSYFSVWSLKYHIIVQGKLALEEDRSRV